MQNTEYDTNTSKLFTIDPEYLKLCTILSSFPQQIFPDQTMQSAVVISEKLPLQELIMAYAFFKKFLEFFCKSEDEGIIWEALLIFARIDPGYYARIMQLSSLESLSVEELYKEFKNFPNLEYHQVLRRYRPKQELRNVLVVNYSFKIQHARVEKISQKLELLHLVAWERFTTAKEDRVSLLVDLVLLELLLHTDTDKVTPTDRLKMIIDNAYIASPEFFTQANFDSFIELWKQVEGFFIPQELSDAIFKHFSIYVIATSIVILSNNETTNLGLENTL